LRLLQHGKTLSKLLVQRHVCELQNVPLYLPKEFFKSEMMCPAII
jgi:hypothetical protein